MYRSEKISQYIIDFLISHISVDKPEGTGITTGLMHNTATEGDNITLTCHVTEANPPVSEYRFYFNDSTAALNTITDINQFTLTSVQRSQHYGSYRCVAHNDAGDGQSVAIVLNITGK